MNVAASVHPSGFRADPGAYSGTPMAIAMDVLRGRHTVPILWSLFWGEKRFYQLLRDLSSVTRKTLDHELARLERLGLVERRVSELAKPGVVYALSATGQTLKPVLGVLFEWGLLARRLKVAERLAAERSLRLPAPTVESPATRLVESNDEAIAPP